jgi:AraC-like DNA-binding protein/mannose-6-phosphate isomerase-like protein (cupin superfamily)
MELQHRDILLTIPGMPDKMKITEICKGMKTMVISEYSQERAEILFKRNLPDIEVPVHIKILWLDSLTDKSISRRNSHEAHAHTFLEIQFVFSGWMGYECNGKTVELSAGNALLIPPGISHRHIQCSQDLEKAVLAFSTTSLLFDGQESRKFEFSENILENMNFILKNCDERTFFSQAILSGRVLEMIASVCRSLGVALPAATGKDVDSRVLVAKAYIEEHKNQAISCEAVARECCLSLKQLNRIFQIENGNSVFAYITAERVRYAKKLLQEESMTVSEVAEAVGISDVNYFIRFFKKQNQCTPKAFQKMGSL